MILVPLMLALSLSFLDVERVPVSTPDAACVVLPINADAAPDLAILDARRLMVALGDNEQAPRALELPPNTSAVDFYDLNNDGAREAIIVSGEQIQRAVFSSAGAPILETLFSVPSQYAAHTGQPFFQVLGVLWEDEPVLVLPTEDALELRRADGSVANRFPLAQLRPRGEWVQPFAAWSVTPPQIAPAGALEWRVSHVVDLSPLLPEALVPEPVRSDGVRRGTTGQASDAATRDPSYWPWFPLTGGAAPATVRVLYAYEPPDLAHTLIRLRRLDAPGEDVGPVRRYPGRLIHLPTGEPDFDGDGFHDLLLLKAAAPPPTIDAISRTLVRGTWPVQLAVHVFDAASGRFAAQAAARIDLDIPLAWAFGNAAGAPLRHVALGDIDGDGRADLGLSTGSDTYAVWRWGDKGLRAAPDFVHTFEEPIQGLAFAETRGANEQMPAIVLRGASALYVLRAEAASRPRILPLPSSLPAPGNRPTAVAAP